MNQKDSKLWGEPAVVSEPRGSQRAMANLVELRQRLAAARKRKEEIDAHRAGIAYEATIDTGLTPGRRRLEKLRVEAAELEQEIHDLELGVKSAEGLLEQARARAARSAHRADAERALELSREMAEAGQLADEAVIATVVRIKRFQELVSECNRLGFGTKRALVDMNLKRSLSSALHAIGLGELAPLPQRIQPGALLQGYAQRVREEATRALSENTDEEAA